MREHVNHASTINRQTRPPVDETDDDDTHFGAHAGIYLSGPAVTVNRKTGAALLADTEIRTRWSAPLSRRETSCRFSWPHVS